VKVQLLAFLSSTSEGEWSVSHPGHITPEPIKQGSWMGANATLEAFEKKKKNFLRLLGIELRFLGHSAHSLVTTLTELWNTTKYQVIYPKHEVLISKYYLPFRFSVM
jgi:hypothetical protein